MVPITLDRLSAKLEGLTPPQGPTIDEAWVDAEGFRLDESGRWGLDVPAKLELRISSLAVAEFLNRTSPGGLSETSVETEPDFLTIRGHVRIVARIAVMVKCRLEVRDKTEIHVVVTDVEVAGVGAKGLVRGKIEAVNPVLSTKDLPIDVELESVRLAEDGVHLTARLMGQVI